MLLFFVSFSSSLFAETPNIGKYPTMFQADDYTVTMLRIGDKEDKVFLIKVDGIDNEFDGQIFKHETKCNVKRCTSYKLETKEIPGKKRWWTIQSTSTWGNYDGLILYPPGIKQKSNLYKVDRPKKFDAQAFYQTYLGQLTQR